MNLIEDKNFLKKESINFIETIILGNNFPFFLNKNTVAKDNNSFMSHVVLKRIEERKNKNKNKINSSYYSNFVKILNEFTEKNNINYKEIFRIAVNFSYKNNSKCSPIHVDHEFPHKQLLVYLNTVKDAFTVIYDESKNRILKKIIPMKYKGVCFDGLPHAGFFPEKGEKIVIVYTFK